MDHKRAIERGPGTFGVSLEQYRIIKRALAFGGATQILESERPHAEELVSRKLGVIDGDIFTPAEGVRTPYMPAALARPGLIR
jgi:hypothetical protein